MVKAHTQKRRKWGVMDDNITPIGVKFKNPPSEDRMLEIVSNRGCLHHVYLIDAKTHKIECAKCKLFFEPMAVLLDLAQAESRWRHSYDRMKEASAKLEERKRCKCEHCNKITRIKI